MAEHHPTIPIICGPTASGKTGVAIELSRTIPLEIVSADSRQIIRQLDIGTAKPTAEERAAVPMHLIDIIEPGERYSAFQFIDDATAAIEDILSRNRLPVIVGGTGLYLRALTEGVVEIQEPDFEIRERLETDIAAGRAEEMYAELKKVDPLEAAKIHPNNHVRLVRALEIYYMTGKPKSELIATGAYRKAKYEFACFCLMPPREGLYAVINQRVDRMMRAGLLGELQGLIESGREEAVRKANVIGYQELLDYLAGKQSLAEAVALIKQNSRRYAKRQMTWFRHQGGITFFSSPEDMLTGLRAQLSEKM